MCKYTWEESKTSFYKKGGVRQRLVGFLLKRRRPVNTSTHILPTRLERGLYPERFAYLLIVMVQPLISFLSVRDPNVSTVP